MKKFRPLHLSIRDSEPRCALKLKDGTPCKSTFDVRKVQLRSPLNRSRYAPRTWLMCGYCRRAMRGQFRYA